MNKYYAISHSIPEYINKVRNELKKINKLESVEYNEIEELPIEKQIIENNQNIYKINNKYLTNITFYRNVEQVRNTISGEIAEILPSNQQHITINIIYFKYFLCDDLLNKRCYFISSGNNPRPIQFFVTNHQINVSPNQTEITIEGIIC